MTDNERVTTESARIRTKLNNMSKEQLLQEILKSKLANYDLTKGRKEDQVYIAHLESTLREYQQGVNKKVLSGIVALQL